MLANWVADLETHQWLLEQTSWRQRLPISDPHWLIVDVMCEALAHKHTIPTAVSNSITHSTLTFENGFIR